MDESIKQLLERKKLLMIEDTLKKESTNKQLLEYN